MSLYFVLFMIYVFMIFWHSVCVALDCAVCNRCVVPHCHRSHSIRAHPQVLHFIEALHVVKNNLFPTPPLFRLIQEQSNTDWREMYQVHQSFRMFVKQTKHAAGAEWCVCVLTCMRLRMYTHDFHTFWSIHSKKNRKKIAKRNTVYPATNYQTYSTIGTKDGEFRAGICRNLESVILP